MTDRTGRQNLIDGWNQEEIENSRIMVVGSGTLAQMVSGALAGVGVNNIYVMDNKKVNDDEKDFLCIRDKDSKKINKIKQIKKTLEKIANENKSGIIARHSPFNEAFTFQFSPEIIVDATNDPRSKESVLDYALRYNIPFISTSSDQDKSIVSCHWPKNKGKIKVFDENPDIESLLNKGYENAYQGGYTSCIAAGIAVEEIRKFKFKYDESDMNLSRDESFVYNNRSDTREGVKNDIQKDLFKRHDKKVLVVGAGALGNFVSLNLAYIGIRHLDIIDMDHIEPNNLNRQLLFYNRQNEKKSEVLAERIKEINQSMDVNGIFGKVGETDEDDKQWIKKLYDIEKEQWSRKPVDMREQNFPEFEEFINIHYRLSDSEREKDVSLFSQDQVKDYDLIFGCLDNKHARMWLNNAVIKYKIPYIDGGTGPKSGQMAAYHPDNTRCIDCQIDLMHFPPKRSCIEGPEGSVVMSNMIIGGLMVGEGIHIFEGNHDKIFNTEIKYDIWSKERVYVKKSRAIRITDCNCS